jgi:hypothetical protein
MSCPDVHGGIGMDKGFDRAHGGEPGRVGGAVDMVGARVRIGDYDGRRQ